MIKRLIFDLDNTLIKWEDHYVDALKKTMLEFNINIDYKLIDNVIEEQEKIRNILNKEILLEDINKKCNLNLDINFINKLFENQKDLSPKKDIEMIKTFTYLSSKYEIVLLTNYFKEVQIGRLEKLGIAKYFKEFYGCEEIILKPNIQAFKTAIKNINSNECIMIGDSYDHDIKGAKEANINIIQVDLKNKINEKKDYPVINNINELRDLL